MIFLPVNGRRTILRMRTVSTPQRLRWTAEKIVIYRIQGARRIPAYLNLRTDDHGFGYGLMIMSYRRGSV
jgi:hypothetical protein